MFPASILVGTYEASGNGGGDDGGTPEYTGSTFGRRWAFDPGWINANHAPSMNYGYGSSTDTDGPHELVFNYNASNATEAQARTTALPFLKGLVGWLTARNTSNVSVGVDYTLNQSDKIRFVYGNFPSITGEHTYIDPANSSATAGIYESSYDSSLNNTLDIAYVLRIKGTFNNPAIGSSGGTSIGLNTNWFQLG